MTTLLIIEDQESLGRSLSEYLAKEGYRIRLAEDLGAAREKAKLGADLIILDWMLPDGQGLDFLAGLRQQGNKVPVIFLTARAELVDRVLGLEMGASDYLTKPFEPRELLARIRVRLREGGGEPALAEGNPGAVLKVGPLVIDRIRHQTFFRDCPVELVKKEFDLLALLAETPEKVFSRDEILNKVWGYEIFPTTRTVDTHIMQLRQKTQDELIETVRAVGYRLRTL
jgi:DNA-binding response OmpR family regulator